MRVAYVTLAPFISGAERALQTVLLHASHAGIEPHVICPASSPFGAWCDAHQIRWSAVTIAERDKWHPLRWIKSLGQIAVVLRRERIDVVHANQVWAYAAAGTAARLLRIPRVCHMRDEVSPEAAQWWCRSGVEAVICVSDHIRRLVNAAWAPRISVLTDPVPGPSVRPVAQVRRTGRTTFGFAGQLIDVKGLVHLIDALSLLKQDDRWELVVAGRDPRAGQPYERRCRRLVDELGLSDRITFVGFLENIDAFYDRIDVAVVPSLEEPLGLIALEAALRAKPAIAFASGGLNETIRHNLTGWLVAPGDVHALKAALARVLDTPAIVGEAGRIAQQVAEPLCDPEAYVRTLAALYDGICSVSLPTHDARAGHDPLTLS
jgi:glycosyltransferase involved in cell wall biosynthesis